MAANECIPYFDAGEDVSAKAEAAVTGCRFVSISDPAESGFQGLGTSGAGGNVVASHAAAGTRADGVASYDAGIGGRFYIVRGKKIVPVTAGANITAGQEVEVGTNGQAIPLDEGIAVGKAFDSADSGDKCPIALY